MKHLWTWRGGEFGENTERCTNHRIYSLGVACLKFILLTRNRFCQWGCKIARSRGSEQLFTPWTMKLSHGHVNMRLAVELVPGPFWSTPRKTMLEWLWNSRSPRDIFWGLHYPLTWSNGFCGGRGKRVALVEKGKGPWQRNIVILVFWWIFFGEEKSKEWWNLKFVKTAFFRHI